MSACVSVERAAWRVLVVSPLALARPVSKTMKNLDTLVRRSRSHLFVKCLFCLQLSVIGVSIWALGLFCAPTSTDSADQDSSQRPAERFVSEMQSVAGSDFDSEIVGNVLRVTVGVEKGISEAVTHVRAIRLTRGTADCLVKSGLGVKHLDVSILIDAFDQFGNARPQLLLRSRYSMATLKLVSFDTISLEDFASLAEPIPETAQRYYRTL